MGARGIAATRHLRGRRQSQRGGHAGKADGLARGVDGGMGSYMDAYLEALQVRNYSAETVTSHREALIQLISWANERELYRADSITRPILESFQRWLYRYRKKNGKPLASGTQRSRLGFIKSYFKWLCRQNHLMHNPASELELPRQEQRLPQEPLSIRQVESVLNVPDIRDPLGVRDRSILEVFYSTGIRRAELTRLSIEDLNQDRMTLQVRQGKGKKDRVVPIGGRALAWLDRYLETVRPQLVVRGGERALFLSSFGEPFNPDSVSQMVKRCIEKAEIGRSGSCHLFRHSCATHMLENGADIRFIQQLLGHAKLDTTQVYTEVSIKQLQEVHARTHPAKIKEA
jgi:integrase/recombinase XerD